MSKRTKQQKIIADLRKQLRVTPPVTAQEPVKRQVEPTVSIPTVSIASPKPVLAASRTLDTSYLPKDLIKVATLVSAAVVLEIITSLLITNGYLKIWGIS